MDTHTQAKPAPLSLILILSVEFHSLLLLHFYFSFLSQALLWGGLYR